MKKPRSVASLEKLGRVRLSKSFFMRDFLYSETANFHGLSNIPEDPDLAIANGRQLCETLLEPLQDTFGRIAIRSAYRSPAVNQCGNEQGYNCAPNERCYASHIWDRLDAEGYRGATACIVVPWFLDRYEQGAGWRAMAYWIHNHLPYSRLRFFPPLCAFNINWHERPTREISSYIEPRGLLLRGEPPRAEYASWYEGFPAPVLKCVGPATAAP